MSKIDELIAKYCPNGVEYKELGKVCKFQRGNSITQNDVTEGDVPVIAGGQKPSYYHNKSNRTGETIAVSSSGAYAGFVSYWTIPVFLSDSFSVNPDMELLTPKYVYYFLKHNQEKIHNTKRGSGVPHVHGSSIAKLLIPIPPLPVQQEIVNILDKFTKLEAKLETELEEELKARRKQYEYYRNRLLSATEVNGKWLMNGVEVEWKTLEEVFYIKNGYTPSKSKSEYWENGTIPWFRMEDIRQNGRILSDSIQHITPDAVKGNGLFPANSIIVATTATIGEHALIIVDSLANQQFTFLTKRELFNEKINMKFFHYFMFIIDEWCKNNTNTASFPSVDMRKFKKYLIPIPPLSEQERIVEILDKFDSLVNDISIGLPAEIEARRKQYEYYRSKLLSFKPK
ncbi:MAG TPA: restriction endonuclease subunit S [Salinivirgaceae bacterium]|nr:restriction endonuclease subunit S [Salinivirgaceae bacterium]